MDEYQNIKSLYVHIPFCAKKCLFCSFAVTIGQGNRTNDYIDALEIEAQAYQNSILKTVYLGGGTPTFLANDELEWVVNMIRNNFSVTQDAEWTIEINPENMDVDKAKMLKRLGFNRVSLGVQSFNEAYLKFLGRAHDRTQAVLAFDILRSVGFENINVDLMYGFPQQTREELNSDLEQVIGLNSEHVSIYTLTIEPNSRFYARQMKLDDDEKLGDDYVFVAKSLENAGIKQYEVSNFARLGFQSKHNAVYWQGGEYIGLGMGAHSFINGVRRWNTSHLKDYLEQVSVRGQAIEGMEELSLHTRFMERIIFGLRMNEGIDPYIIEKDMSYPMPGETRVLIDAFIQDGFLEQKGGVIKTTQRGRLVLDELACRLI